MLRAGAAAHVEIGRPAKAAAPDSRFPTRSSQEHAQRRPRQTILDQIPAPSDVHYGVRFDVASRSVSIDGPDGQSECTSPCDRPDAARIDALPVARPRSGSIATTSSTLLMLSRSASGTHIKFLGTPSVAGEREGPPGAVGDPQRKRNAFLVRRAAAETADRRDTSDTRRPRHEVIRRESTIFSGARCHAARFGDPLQAAPPVPLRSHGPHLQHFPHCSTRMIGSYMNCGDTQFYLIFNLRQILSGITANLAF